MADRYTYLSLIGIFIMAAWAIPAAWTQWLKSRFFIRRRGCGLLLFLVTVC